MIGKLRRRFIITAMLSVTAVLVVLIGAINLFNFMDVIKNADAVLDILTANNGGFPDEMPQPPGGDPFGFPGDMRRGQMSPEMQYEARFFTVYLDEDGTVIIIDTGRIAAVDSKAAANIGLTIYSSGKARGFIGDYRYRVSDMGEGVSCIVFYDCGRSLDNARAFLWISLIISAVGLLIFFVLIAVSSKAVVKPAADAYERQKRFITDAGHELKTPLAVIKADCDVLEMDDDGDNEWLADIRKQTERMTELTNRLIYLAKTQEGSKSELKKIEFPLSDMVSEEVESFKGPAISSGKELETDIAPGISYNGDPKALAGLVSILMENAVKYSPEGGKIKASLQKNGSKILLSVYNDTAEPVSQDDMKHMFDRFYRTDKSRNSETGGYGIGLSIAKGVTEAHGGNIYATGSGKGITVTAEL